MTKEQIKQWLDGASKDQLADFNDNADKQFAPVNGNGDTDGAEYAEGFNNLADTEQQWIIDHVTNVKHPCD